jgi:hypothetical protein
VKAGVLTVVFFFVVVVFGVVFVVVFGVVFFVVVDFFMLVLDLDVDLLVLELLKLELELDDLKLELLLRLLENPFAIPSDANANTKIIATTKLKILFICYSPLYL